MKSFRPQKRLDKARDRGIGRWIPATTSSLISEESVGLIFLSDRSPYKTKKSFKIFKYNYLLLYLLNNIFGVVYGCCLGFTNHNLFIYKDVSDVVVVWFEFVWYSSRTVCGFNNCWLLNSIAHFIWKSYENHISIFSYFVGCFGHHAHDWA